MNPQDQDSDVMSLQALTLRSSKDQAKQMTSGVKGMEDRNGSIPSAFPGILLLSSSEAADDPAAQGLFCSPCAANSSTDADDSSNQNLAVKRAANNNTTICDDYTTIKTLGTTRRTQLMVALDESEDDGLDSSSRVLVIQSLLRPLNGVDHVQILIPDQPMESTASLPATATTAAAANKENFLVASSSSPPSSWRCQVLIDHDMQTSPDQLVSLLQQSLKCSVCLLTIPEESMMHTNGIIDDDRVVSKVMVRSQFQVQGICCASEIPSVQKILRLTGVSKVQINITAQAVYLQHDVASISAQDIANRLTQQGFSTKILKDGGGLEPRSSFSSKASLPSVGRTALHVEHVLTEQDVAYLPQVWAQTHGVVRVGVNAGESVVYIEHDVFQISSEDLLDVLFKHDNFQSKSYAAKIVVRGKDELEQREFEALFVSGLTPSKYVESTLLVSNLTVRHVPLIAKALKQNFIRAQLRAFYPHVPSRMVKIEHNPELMDIELVVTVLARFGLQATVAIDGAVDGLALPLMEDYPSGGSDGVRSSFESDDDLRSSLRLNVLLSGIFWVVTVLSFIGGSWHYLEYAGLLSVLFGLPPVAVKAWRTVNRCQFDANCMMVIAALGALALGEIDEAASVSFLFAISELLEHRATARARRALGEIVNLRPDHANVIHPLTKDTIVVPADKVPIGALISVRTGDKIVADGIVVEGTSTVDESSLTGEAIPVPKSVNDHVSGGSINVGSTRLVVKTTTSVDDSAVSRLIRLVEEAQANRSPTEIMIDSFARSYTPVVITLAATMCTMPWFFGHEIGRRWTLNGLIIIVIACPCALTISTPVTYAAGLAATAQRGVIVKGGMRLEALGSVDKVIFDKTGTLTRGNFTVRHLEKIGAEYDRRKVLELLALIEAPSSHPLAATLVKAAKIEGVSIPNNMQLLQHTVLKGEGVTAVIDGRRVFAGNRHLFERIGMFDDLSLNYQELCEKWNRDGSTVGFLGIEGKGIIAIYCVEDTVRDEAKDVVSSLHDGGIEVYMLTGDSDSAAKAIAKQVGLHEDFVHSQLLPEDKLRFVGSLVKPVPRHCGLCRQKSLVLMCGDGVNDAPALAAADVGVAMGEGAALAMEMSDITLMDSNLNKLLYAIKMGTRVVHTIQENIVLSLLSKLIVVGLTFAGKMTLLVAIASDVCVMLIVTLNGMKLLPGYTSGPTDILRIRTQRAREYEMLTQRSFHGTPNTTEIV